MDNIYSNTHVHFLRSGHIANKTTLLFTYLGLKSKHKFAYIIQGCLENGLNWLWHGLDEPVTPVNVLPPDFGGFNVFGGDVTPTPETAGDEFWNFDPATRPLSARLPSLFLCTEMFV